MKGTLTKSFCRVLCLALLLVIGLLSACGAENAETPSDAPDVPDSVASDATSSEEAFVLFSNLPNKTFDGEEVTFLVEGDYQLSYASVEILPNDASDSGLQEAIKARNDLVEEAFGVTIKEVRTESGGDLVNRIRNGMAAGTSEYDIVMPYMADAARLAQEGILYDLRTLENIHLNQSYYDQGSVRDLSIAGKNYFVTGDVSLLTWDVTHVLEFNKDMVKEYGLENPYDLVESGKWTIDKLREMARQVTEDTDGLPGMSYLDTYGFLVNRNFVSSMFIGCGQRFSVKNGDDEPELAVYSAEGTAVFDKIFDLVNDQKASGLIDLDGGGFASSAVDAGKTVWKAADEATANKRALFHAASLRGILGLGEYDCNFGILPAPKYDEAQDEYFCRVSTLYATCITIPLNVRDVELSSVIADAMMQASTDTVREAYIDVIMKKRKIQDSESEKMLDIIFESCVYDFGSIYNWGGSSEYDIRSITGFMNDVAFSGVNDFTSRWESIASAVQTAMEDTIDTYRNLS